MTNWAVIANMGGVYEVSDDGRVRSTPRTVEFRTRWGSIAQRRLSGKPIVVFVHPHGYRQVSLAGAMFYVHRLVAAAFIGEQPAGREVDHINGDRADNRVSNLRWATKSENQWNRVSTSALSGERGLTHRPGRPRPWHVRSGLDGRQCYVGSFATKEQAVTARNEFERVNRV